MTVIFPKWANKVPAMLGAGVVGAGVLAVFVVWFWFSPRHLEVGYQPRQPILYSHKLHAGEMGMDCRYCHTTVEQGPHANVPPTGTCMNCHKQVRTHRPEIQKLAAAYESGEPIEWIKVHMLPDYAYFNHAAHVTVGIGCASCHGRIDQMEIVRQAEPLNMGWCLDCHRDGGFVDHLRPVEEVTNMSYEQTPEVRERAIQLWKDEVINPPTHCSACHR